MHPAFRGSSGRTEEARVKVAEAIGSKYRRPLFDALQIELDDLMERAPVK
jgi:hypothetical protein